MLNRRSAGISLVEILIVVTLVAILVLQGLPVVTGQMASSRIRTAAEGYSNGMAQARAEAVRLNTNVEFLLATGLWQVRSVVDGAILHQAAGKETTVDVVTTIAPADATRITFNPFGRIIATNPVDGSPTITRVDFDVANGADLGSSRRALRVIVQTGGIVKMCDPLLSSTDPRACA